MQRCDKGQSLLRWRDRFLSDDDAVGIAVDVVSGHEVHAAKTNDNVAITLAGLGRFPRVSAKGFATKLHSSDDLGITDGAIDDDTSPAVVFAEACDDVTNEGAAHGGTAVNDQHSARIVFAKNLLQQGIVLEAFHGSDAAAEFYVSTQITELRIAGSNVFSDDVH